MRLEVAFPPGGPRRRLQQIDGERLVAALEAGGVYRPCGVARRYPCPCPTGAGCPRRLVAINGSWHAVCGNDPSECDDIVLTPEDVTLLRLDPIGLCRAIASALSLRALPEEIAGIANAFRIGLPPTGGHARPPAFLIVRYTPRSYAEALEALRSRRNGDCFAALVPTDRYVSDDLNVAMRRAGNVIVSLADLVGLEDAGLVAPHPLPLFAGVGDAGRFIGSDDVVVADAYIRRRGEAVIRQPLDQAGYDRLCATANDFDVFADELAGIVFKQGGEYRKDAPSSYFQTIRSAVTARGVYDPNVEGPDRISGKQIFQRARAVFDRKAEDGRWRIFKSVRSDDGHGAYRFAPDADISLSFVFLPEK
ncbi:MAG TPA: hypothetical protein PKZ97_10475 [Azospirillaceae bacterium]|nr:hypothetical protein [Azospirillaceae bacterium]HRQ81533.1 hypothetical protein [Azospirillaceae bacterium]